MLLQSRNISRDESAKCYWSSWIQRVLETNDDDFYGVLEINVTFVVYFELDKQGFGNKV